MIHICTCIGGSTSTISSRKTRGGTTVFCKNCGGRPAIDGKSSSSCLLSTVLELTSLINSDFTWTKVSKGCRSSSRRPRKSTSDTINLACGKLLTSNSTDLEMPVSESEKLGVSVLECHFSEKAEHIPIKKRRFLFRASSPTPNIPNPPLEDEGRHETSPKLTSNANILSTETCESRSKDHKPDQNKLVKDDDFSGISILAAAACSNSLGAETDRRGQSEVIRFNETNVKKEPDCHISTAPSKVEESALNTSSQVLLESTSSKKDQEPVMQTSPARDARFSWDLNTVMDAWEEPPSSEHGISASVAANDNVTHVEEKQSDYTKDNSGNLPVNPSRESKVLRVEKCEPLSHDFEIVQNHVAVKAESMHDKQTDGVFSKWANLSGQSSGDFDRTQAVNTKLSMDYSIPPGFDHCFDPHTGKKNFGPTAKHGLSPNTATCMEDEPPQSGLTSNKVGEDMTKMELASNVAMEDKVNKEDTEQPAAVSSVRDAACSDADNGLGYDDSRNGDKLDESLVGYDSQYEDGELRESALKGYRLNKIKHGSNLSIVDANETSSLNVQNSSSAIRKPAEVGSRKESDLTPSVVLPEKLHSSDDALSGSVPNDIISSQEKDMVQQHASSQSDEWKMNVSGWDVLPENSNFTKPRNFTGRKFSYREEPKDRFEPEDLEMKGEGSRFYRKDSLTRIGGPSTRDVFLSRDRFQMQRCSPKDGDGLASRSERESGALRSFGRGRYSPHNRPDHRDGRFWNRSPERSREGGSFHRSILEDSRTMDNMTNEGGMDLRDTGRHNTSSYATRRAFRSRSPSNREVNDFRARLGLRPTADAGYDRFVSRGRGRGRSVRYGTQFEGDGPRGRFHAPASDECDEFMTEYSHPFPRSRRGFSPIDRRGNNNSYQHHQSDSRSPPPSRPRTRSPMGNGSFRRRSRSPGFRPDGRIRRPRSPPYRDHPSEYNSGPRNNNSPPPNSRWVNYKERVVYNRSSPPPGRPDGLHGERFGFYDSSRKQKQNEYYRSGHPGRFSDLNDGGRGRPRYVDNDSDRPNNGYRRGGFVRRYNMDGPTKRIHYDNEDGFGLAFDARDRQALEAHARSNPNPDPSPKPSGDGTDSRFRDFPRRQREDAGEIKRRSREGKEAKESEHVTSDFERQPGEVKDQSTTSSTTNVDSMTANDVKEGENKAPISGSSN